jgi:agmatinase
MAAPLYTSEANYQDFVEELVDMTSALFDPSGTASFEVGLFGIPSDPEQAAVVVIPVPWDVTTSYGGGASKGPMCVWKASPQIDLFDLELGTSFERGFHLLPLPESLRKKNDELRTLALKVRAELENSSEGTLRPETQKTQDAINVACQEMTDWVYGQAQSALKRGQIPVVLGGDHSTPEGNIRAVSEAFQGDVSVLHLDAHMDLRASYQGFTRSHASIMHNVMSASWRPKRLVQFGIRDFSAEEFALAKKRKDIEVHFDAHLKQKLFSGVPWTKLVAGLLKNLSRNVYLSFDIDGLSPEFCPHTGTPVPGGLSFDQVVHVLRLLVQSKRRIVGFDLNEVAPDPLSQGEWDGNVGARLLYKMCGFAVLSQKKGGLSQKKTTPRRARRRR